MDTVTIYSNAMQKEYKCVVIQPTAMPDKNTPLPVVYLLHGHGGWYANWIIRVPQLKDYADQYQLMIVCPDGGYIPRYGLKRMSVKKYQLILMHITTLSKTEKQERLQG